MTGRTITLLRQHWRSNNRRAKWRKKWGTKLQKWKMQDWKTCVFPWCCDGYTGWIIKTSPIFCLRKDTCSKPRQNCFGNWIEHCLHYTYLSRQLRHSRRHWEISYEEGTLLKSVNQQVTFHLSFQIPIFEKVDSKHRSFLEWENWCRFHWSVENKSWPELLHWSVEDFVTAWMSSTLSGQWLWIPARRCSVTPRKSDATVSTTEHSRLHSCWWWMGIIFSISQSFKLLHLGYPAWFGVRMPTTSVCKSTGPQRGNQSQMEEGHH